MTETTHDLRGLQTGINQYLDQYLAGQSSRYASRPVMGPLFEVVCHYVRRPGKRLRPALFLSGCRVFRVAPDFSREGLLAVASATEILHAFILIHDDLIDRSDARRGQPSLHRVLEEKLPAFADRERTAFNLALVLGDLVFALAQRCLVEGPLPPAVVVRLQQRLLEDVMETGGGELADILYGGRDLTKVEQDEIERMYSAKTTLYTIEGPLALAAILSGATPSEIEALGRITEPAGLAFQIRNDLAEFEQFEISDSSISADLLEGKKTLLLRTAYDRLSPTDQTILQLCLGSGPANDTRLTKIRELVVASGAVSVLSTRVDQLLGESFAAIDQSPFQPEVQAGLRAVFEDLVWQVTSSSGSAVKLPG